MATEATLILDHDQVERKVQRIAHEILEKHHSEKELIMIGIAKRGVVLSEKLTTILNGISKIKVRNASITLDKDDPLSVPIELSIGMEELHGKCVLLVDDVLQGGMTLMHAAAYIVQAPISKLTTVVLVDRRHRKFPIRADIVGLTLSTTLQEHISVKLSGKKMLVQLDQG